MATPSDTGVEVKLSQILRGKKDVLDCEENIWINLKKVFADKPYCAQALKRYVADIEIMAIIFLIIFAVGFCLVLSALNPDGSLNGNVAPNTSIAAWSFGIVGLVFFLVAMITVCSIGNKTETWLNEVTNEGLIKYKLKETITSTNSVRDQ